MEFSLGPHTRAPFFVVTNRIPFIDTETSPHWRSLEEGGSGFEVEDEGTDEEGVGVWEVERGRGKRKKRRSELRVGRRPFTCF